MRLKLRLKIKMPTENTGAYLIGHTFTASVMALTVSSVCMFVDIPSLV